MRKVRGRRERQGGDMTDHTDVDPLCLTAVSPDAPEQVAELAALAEETFIEAYADKVDAAVLVPYARDVFAPDLREAVVRGAADAFWVVRDSAAVAYASVRLPSATERPATIYLDRIYVRGSSRRQGLGRLLMDEALSRGKRAGMTRICLGVWEANTPAIAFYEALGFAPCGQETFRLGSLRQRDIVMCRHLS